MTSRFKTAPKLVLGSFVILLSLLVGERAIAGGGPPIPLGGTPGGSGQRVIKATPGALRPEAESNRRPGNSGSQDL